MKITARRLIVLAAVPLAAACATGGGRAAAVGRTGGTGGRDAGTGGLAPGRSVTGALRPSDPQFRDGSHYRRYDFTARAGETLTVDLTSDDFDAYLILADRFGNPVSRNDDGGEDCNARLTYVVRATGPHRLYANASWRAELGAYRLSMRRGGGGAAGDSTCRGFGQVHGMIRPGETVEGELTADDPLFSSDSTYLQRWILPLDAGQTVTIDLISEAFDAYLLLTHGRSDRLAENDDGGGDCDSRIVYTAVDDHPVRVVVNTVRPRATGRYTLRVTTGARRIESKGDCPEDAAGSG